MDIDGDGKIPPVDDYGLPNINTTGYLPDMDQHVELVVQLHEQLSCHTFDFEFLRLGELRLGLGEQVEAGQFRRQARPIYGQRLLRLEPIDANTLNARSSSICAGRIAGVCA